MKCVGTLTKCPQTAGGRSRRGSPKAGTTVYVDQRNSEIKSSTLFIKVFARNDFATVTSCIRFYLVDIHIPQCNAYAVSEKWTIQFADKIEMLSRCLRCSALRLAAKV